MGRKAFYNGKRYEVPTPGAGLEPGTVDWELARRQVRRRRRTEDNRFEERIAANEETEPKGIWKMFDMIVRFFRTPY